MRVSSTGMVTSALFQVGLGKNARTVVCKGQRGVDERHAEACFHGSSHAHCLGYPHSLPLPLLSLKSCRAVQGEPPHGMAKGVRCVLSNLRGLSLFWKTRSIELGDESSCVCVGVQGHIRLCVRMHRVHKHGVRVGGLAATQTSQHNVRVQGNLRLENWRTDTRGMTSPRCCSLQLSRLAFS